MKKRVLVSLAVAFLSVCAVICIISAVYFNKNKLNADVSCSGVSTVEALKDPEFIELRSFPTWLKRKIKKNPDNYYMLDLILNINNDKPDSYFLWKCFLENNSKDLKVWIDKDTPESFSQTIEAQSTYVGNPHFVIAYKENSNESEVRELFEKYVDVYAVGLRVIPALEE